MGLRKTPAVLVAVGAAAALTIAGCSSSSSNSSPGAGSSSGSSSAPAQLVVWRLGASVPAETTWMNSTVIPQFHKDFPQYAKTQVKVVWIPWTNVTSDWTTAEAGGKNAPDITELGNTETPTEATAGALANITSYVNSWSNKSGLIAGELANDNQNGNYYAVPLFGGVRGIWYRTDEFKAAGITSTPTTWAELLSDAQKLMKKYPSMYGGIGAPSNDTDAFASFIWGAGGQIATESGGKWTADLTSAAAEAGIKFYVDLYSTYHVSPSKYVGETELGNIGATSGGANEDFFLGKLGMYIDGPWATQNFTGTIADKANLASFPIPSENGPNAAPVFAGGSDLGIWSTSKYPQADWDLIQTMDSPSNATSFDSALDYDYFPPYTSELSNTNYTGQILSGFAKAAQTTQISPLNAKNWSTADSTDYVIPDMLKALMQGAPFQSTVAKYNTELQNVLNTGTES